MNKEWGQTNFAQFGIQRKAAALFVGRLNRTVAGSQTTALPSEQFPKGEADVGETPQQAAAREVGEEVTPQLGQACSDAIGEGAVPLFSNTNQYGSKFIYWVDVTGLEGVWENKVDDCFVTNLAPGKETDYAVWRSVSQLEHYVAPKTIHATVMDALVEVCASSDYSASTTGSDTASDTGSDLSGSFDVSASGSSSGASGAPPTPTAQSWQGHHVSVRQVPFRNGAPSQAYRSKPGPGPGYVCKICKDGGHWFQQCPQLEPRPRYK
jgi:hypothetical protein